MLERRWRGCADPAADPAHSLALVPVSTTGIGPLIVGQVRPKVDAEELPGIVEELTRIQREEEGALDRRQTQELLRELDLPDDRLDEARAALAVRRAREEERRKRLKLAGAVGMALLLLGLALGWRDHQRDRAIEQVIAGRVALTMAGAPVAGVVSRSARPELGLQVVLQHAPRDAELALSCDWRGPGGELLHQNHWQTKAIDKDVWPTQCRRRFDAADPAVPDETFAVILQRNESKRHSHARIRRARRRTRGRDQFVGSERRRRRICPSRLSRRAQDVGAIGGGRAGG